jgi:hypothetical protein
METIQHLVIEAKQDNASREALLASLRGAVQDLETPQEAFWRMLVEPHAYGVVRSAIQLRLFELLQKSGTCTADELAQQSDADKLLVVRFMRVLTAMGLVKEVGVQKYENGAGGNVLATDPGLRGALSFMYGTSLTSKETLLMTNTGSMSPPSRP